MQRGRLIEREGDRFITARSLDRDIHLEEYNINYSISNFLIIFRQF